MTKSPDPATIDKSPGLAALQEIKYQEETPEGNDWHLLCTIIISSKLILVIIFIFKNKRSETNENTCHMYSSVPMHATCPCEP